MKEINCNIIRDILPLYVDNVVCEDTKIMVEEHLKHCKSCRETARKLTQEIVLPSDANVQLQEAKPLKDFKKKMSRKRILVSLVSILMTLVTAAVLLGTHHLLYRRGIPVSSDEITAVTTIKPDNNGYLNQSWEILLTNGEGKPLTGKQETVYKENSDGTQVECGYRLYVYELPFYTTSTPWLSIGYAYDDDTTTLKKDFDYTVEIVYKDKTQVFSMREDGLFTPNASTTPKVRNDGWLHQ